MTADNEEWRRGFEDCAELVRDLLEACGSLDEVKAGVDKILALVKEKKFERIREELGLF